MFVGEYIYNQSYFDFNTDDELPEEGILKGNEGEFRFKQVSDGIAVYDSTLLNSGFLYPGSPDDIYVPHTINGIPVTELHQNILLESKIQFSIEHGNLKRIFLTIGRKTLADQLQQCDNPFAVLVSTLCLQENNSAQTDTKIEVDFFCGNKSKIDCSISSTSELVLHVPEVEVLKVNAYKTELRGRIPACIKELYFSGKVYPYIEPDWDYDEPNNNCFKGLKELITVDGSLSGKNGWSFRECASLQTVHLSDGIEMIPPYAFKGCHSLKDLYIPDTVSEIGDYAFSDCENLASIHLPEHIKKISEGMFLNCRSLRKVYLSDDIEIIEDYAFAGCISLRKPWIPKNIKHMSEKAFS